MTFEVHIDTSKLDRYFASVEEGMETLTYVVDDRMKPIIQEIVDLAKTFCHVITGRLRESIHSEQWALMDYWIVADAVNPKQDYIYASDEEYGNSRRPPHPFIRPAVELHEQAIIDAVIEEVRTVINGRAYP